eukprot:5096394-Ditylum_brightwellii.AAC.1
MNDDDNKTNNALPTLDDENVPPLWSYHNFEGYSVKNMENNKSYNAIYQYGKPLSIKEFVARAQLACHQQYKSLIE